MNESAAIDHDAPLGNADEVYRNEMIAETTFNMEGTGFHARDEDNESAKIRVDDIFKGKVALVTFTETEVESTAFTRLSPDDARLLGNVLIRAADYAEVQCDE